MRYLTAFMVIVLLLTSFLIPAQAQTQVIAPNVFLRGLQLADGVRYTAAFIKPSDNTAMRNMSVEITLPPDAEFLNMMVPQQAQFHVVRVNQAGALTLIWQTSRVAGEVPLDTFSFTVAQPLTSEVEFYLKWQTEDRLTVVENFLEVPPITVATDTEGSLSPLPEGGYEPIGNTGIQIAAPGNSALVAARMLADNFNPPEEFDDVWWCSLLELTGLDAGKTAEVIVPLRRPVAPFTALQMFQQQADGSWLALSTQAIVTADGLFAMYTHPGGLVATGGKEEIRAEVVVAVDLNIPVQAGFDQDELKDEFLVLEGDPNAPPAEANQEDEFKGDEVLLPPAGETTNVESDPNAPPAILGVSPAEETVVASEPEPNPLENERNQQGGEQQPQPAADRDNQAAQPAAAASNTQVRPENQQAQPPASPGGANQTQTTPFSLTTTVPVAAPENTTTDTVASDQNTAVSGEAPPPGEEQPAAPAENTTTVSDATEQINTTETTAASTNTTANSSSNTSGDSSAPVEETASPPALLNTVIEINPLEGTTELQPFGSGGVRVAIFADSAGEVIQCQVGEISCATLNRRLGAGLR